MSAPSLKPPLLTERQKKNLYLKIEIKIPIINFFLGMSKNLQKILGKKKILGFQKSAGNSVFVLKKVTCPKLPFCCVFEPIFFSS
jgi:hypothetical protein